MTDSCQTKAYNSLRKVPAEFSSSSAASTADRETSYWNTEY